MFIVWCFLFGLSTGVDWSNKGVWNYGCKYFDIIMSGNYALALLRQMLTLRQRFRERFLYAYIWNFKHQGMHNLQLLVNDNVYKFLT